MEPLAESQRNIVSLSRLIYRLLIEYFAECLYHLGKTIEWALIVFGVIHFLYSLFLVRAKYNAIVRYNGTSVPALERVKVLAFTRGALY